MATRAPRSRAAQAAAALLTERVRYVEDLEAAVDARRSAEAAVEAARVAADEATETARKVYAAARGAGWTDAELGQLGYADARPVRVAVRRRRESDGTAGTAGAAPAVPAAGEPATDGPAMGGPAAGGVTSPADESASGDLAAVTSGRVS